MSEHGSPILQRRRGLYAPERLLMLVDGVFAISMTLLVLDVRVPDDAVGLVPLVWLVLAVVDPLAHRLHLLLPRRTTPVEPAA